MNLRHYHIKYNEPTAVNLAASDIGLPSEPVHKIHEPFDDRWLALSALVHADRVFFFGAAVQLLPLLKVRG